MSEKTYTIEELAIAWAESRYNRIPYKDGPAKQEAYEEIAQMIKDAGYEYGEVNSSAIEQVVKKTRPDEWPKKKQWEDKSREAFKYALMVVFDRLPKKPSIEAKAPMPEKETFVNKPKAKAEETDQEKYQRELDEENDRLEEEQEIAKGDYSGGIPAPNRLSPEEQEEMDLLLGYVK